MSASDYRAERLTRSLRTIANPKVRGAALLTVDALLERTMPPHRTAHPTQFRKIGNPPCLQALLRRAVRG